MHAYGIIHVDIKLANIGLISGEWAEDLAEARERKVNGLLHLYHYLHN